MSVVINTNYAATVASNNLASSNSMLQKSLNRLSSGTKIVNPADDAGGLAVSMKLSAAAKRQGAVSANIGNTTSYLQTQDGALKVTGKVLDRISELKTLSMDPTKNASDLANYNAEFTALKAQITSLGAEKFNGINLFGTNDLSVKTTEDGTGSVTSTAVNLLGTGSAAFAPIVDNFANLDNWADTSSGTGVAAVAGNVLSLTTNAGGAGNVTSASTFSGPFTMTMEIRGPNSTAVYLGGAAIAIGAGINDSNWHSLVVTSDGAGNTNATLDGNPFESHTGLSTAAATIRLYNFVQPTTIDFRNFSITSTAGGSTSGNVSDVTTAANLTSLNLSSVTGAIQDVATYRAQNGATQSRLSFSDELLTVNKANLEAATSRIMDVDVASESTSLARWNILVQSGTAMLSQANQSAQTALRLLS